MDLSSIMEVLADFDNIDYMPHEHDVLRHENGAVSTFGKAEHTAIGPMVPVTTILPSPIQKIHVQGVIEV